VVGTDVETCPIVMTTEDTLATPSSVCPVADVSDDVSNRAISTYVGGDSDRAVSTCDVIAAPDVATSVCGITMVPDCATSVYDVAAAPDCAASIFGATIAPHCATSAYDMTAAPGHAMPTLGAQGVPSFNSSPWTPPPVVLP
jgi:hypothetical protein